MVVRLHPGFAFQTCGLQLNFLYIGFTRSYFVIYLRRTLRMTLKMTLRMTLKTQMVLKQYIS